MSRFYGYWLPFVIYVSFLLICPTMTIVQWVIPWTTSLQAALISIMIVIFSSAEANPEPFRLSQRGDWLRFCGFFLAYGAIAPTRPLDIVVWLPFALAYLLRSTIATVQFDPRNRPIGVIFLCLLVAGGAGSVFVIFYLGFNFAIHHSPLGLYYSEVAKMTIYAPTDLIEKLFSILWNSEAVYGEDNQALFQQFPIFGIFFAICVVTAFFARDIRQWIIITMFLNFIVYLPYGDLLPTGFFRYFNLHYFKWMYPWLTVIAVAQLATWLASMLRSHVARISLAASAIVMALGANLTIAPSARESVADSREAVSRTIHITLPERRNVEFIDIQGLTGGFNDFYFGTHALTADGELVKRGTYRLLPVPGGGRLLFLRPRMVTSVELVPAAPIGFADGKGRSVLASTEIAVGCAFHRCVAPPILNWDGNQARIDFRVAGENEGVAFDDWWGGEPWGRWSRRASSAIDLILKTTGPLRIEALTFPLLGHGRPTSRVALVVNGCEIAAHVFDASKIAALEGDIPTRCIGAEGRLHIEWRADGAPSPKDLKINEDVREIGVGVSEVIIRKTK